MDSLDLTRSFLVSVIIVLSSILIAVFHDTPAAKGLHKFRKAALKSNSDLVEPWLVYAVCVYTLEEDIEQAFKVFQTLSSKTPDLSFFALWFKLEHLKPESNGTHLPERILNIFNILISTAGLSPNSKSLKEMSSLETFAFAKKIEMASVALKDAQPSLDSGRTIMLMNSEHSDIYIQMVKSNLLDTSFPRHQLDRILGASLQPAELMSCELLMNSILYLPFKFSHLEKLQMLSKISIIFPANSRFSNLEAQEFLRHNEAFEMRIVLNSRIQEYFAGVGHKGQSVAHPCAVFVLQNVADAELKTYACSLVRLFKWFEIAVSAIGQTTPRVWLVYANTLVKYLKSLIHNHRDALLTGSISHASIDTKNKIQSLLYNLESVCRRGLCCFPSKVLSFYYLFSSLKFLLATDSQKSDDEAEDKYLEDVVNKTLEMQKENLNFEADLSNVFSGCTADFETYFS